MNLIASNFCKDGFLIFKDEIALIVEIEEGKVSNDDGIGVSWEMCPKAFIFRSHDNLFFGLLDDDHFDEGRECKDDHNCNDDPDDAANLQDFVSFV